MADNQNYWLVKFAPFRTSWMEIVQHGKFTLRGVRSPTARKHLAAMRLGDQVLYYHSQKELAVLGVMKVAREAYPDPTSFDPQWFTCDFTPLQTLPRSVTLAELKAEPRLTNFALLSQPRLAVMPVALEHFQIITQKSRV
jgi:predicted RNA-binding protein with PUA-like domain